MKFSGNPVSPGIAAGPVFLYTPFKPQLEENLIPESAVEENIKKYEDLRDKAKAELDAIRAKLEVEDPEKAKIFAAHNDILFDDAMDEEIRDAITYDYYSPEWAIQKTYDKFIRILSKAKDEIIRERVADLRDVRSRLIRIWFNVPEKNLSTLEKPVVVVAYDLFPSDTATLDRSKVLAIVTEIGGPTSHSAIIARSYEIPAVLGFQDAMTLLKDDEEVIVDAVAGNIITEPDEATLTEYAAKREAYLIKAADTKKYKDVVAVTKDGVRIAVEQNIASADAMELEGSTCTDGVGLFRSEFLYMGREQLPTEDEQTDLYKKVLTAYGERPVILRTMDIGGDKKLDCMEMPKEENPFLGLRALRLSFANLPIFKTQLRAAFRASVNGNLWIMFPMVGSMDDIYRAKGIVEEVKAELKAEGIAYSENVKIGIMVEVPTIAVIADIAAKEVDFCSIGTNDLTQYSTAVDRMNPSVTSYYQTFHPALFRLIGHVVKSFNAEGKSVGVCGEMGGNPLTAAVLMGLGMRTLSMGIASVAGIKKLVTNITIPELEVLANKVVNMATASEIEEFLKK